MSHTLSAFPLTLGLFEKRIDGDDCLMQLAQLRFRQAGMGAEIYAVTPEQLEWTLQFRPATGSAVIAHLARKLDLVDDEARRQIENFARRFAGRIYGMVIHDSPSLTENPSRYLDAAREMNGRLEKIENAPWFFIEYAIGAPLESFVGFFESIHGLDRVSVCLDIGHVGIHESRQVYARLHPGVDVCALKSQPEKIPALIGDIEKSVHAALPAVLGLIRKLGTFVPRVHFHLHDGHPLSASSPFGVSDHLGFLAGIPLSFVHHGRHDAATMFGRAGLAQVVAEALRVFPRERISFTLEIHPTGGRLPLDDAAPLFRHWRDKTNAELMNHWLSVLNENHRLLCEAVRMAEASPPAAMVQRC